MATPYHRYYTVEREEATQGHKWGPALVACGIAAMCAAMVVLQFNGSTVALPTSNFVALSNVVRPAPLASRFVTRMQAQSNPQELSRRGTLAFGAAALMTQGQAAQAVQGLTAGRIPGFGPVDENGIKPYVRPEGKSGGHGVGWSEIPQYQFDVPADFQEIAVSIADLGGTEIDARFTSEQYGDIALIVAPVARFKDIGWNAKVKLNELTATPEALVLGFAPEVLGNPIEEEDIVDFQEDMRGELLFYQWEVRPRNIIVASATGNRLFLMVIRAKARQWAAHRKELIEIGKSFKVPPANFVDF
uniref:PsbP C-terminal domain-containing protein n=1 Tax=Eutreptiella gymnastica TaxID=73025 RepID=A0A7S1NRN9_9EUGL|mmetsp:Transcript_80809/g.142411  ORF Transcript_80809/g.142411 Transcript_80809/m.142411 type:complete len:303 (+) Transcript_80809:20-928(+)